MVGILRIGEYAFFAYVTTVFLSDQKVLKKAVIIVGCSTVVVSLLTILQFFFQHSVGGIFYFLGERTFFQQTPGIANASLQGTLILRPYGMFPHPNVLAGYLSVSLTLFLYLFPLFKKEKFKRVFLIVTFLIGLSALFLTLGRSALVGGTVIFIIWFFSQRTYALSRSLLIGLLIIAGIFISGMVFRFTSLSLTDTAVIERVEQYKNAYQVFLTSPLFGVGYKNYLPSLTHLEIVSTGFRFFQPVHNVFFLLLVETGIIGFLIFLIGLGKLIKQLLHTKKSLLPLSLFMFFILTGFFDHYWYTLHQGQLLGAFVIGLLFVKYR